MDESSRLEYPGVLATISPDQAVHVLNDRVKRINRVNVEIAEWLQERRRVEEQYVLGLRRLTQYKVPNAQSELGVFQGPWTRVIEDVEKVALSHHQFAENVERDVETPLRSFHLRKDVADMSTMSANLSTMAKTLDEAQRDNEKLGRKGAKVSVQKLADASAKLESATQQWESTAPYIFESLQALDESRINHLRDVLTQYQTNETDCAQRKLDASANTLSQLLEISTETEVLGFVDKVSSARERTPTQHSNRRSSIVETQTSPTPSNLGAASALGQSTATPTISYPPPSSDGPSVEPPPAPEPKLGESFPPPPTSPPHLSRPLTRHAESKLRRLGTILGGRRRQSIHPSMPSQKTGLSPFGRLGGKESHGVSPKGSYGNLKDSNRLGALSEAPDLPENEEDQFVDRSLHEGNTNGNGVVGLSENLMDSPVPQSTAIGVDESTQESSGATPPGESFNRSQIPATQASSSQPEQQLQQPPAPPAKDAEGYTIPAPVNDPISAAQREASGITNDEAEQLFRLNIQNKPIEEEDPQAKQAALSSVANSLKAGPAVRRTGTTRGRRDVRNTIYVPSPNVVPSGGAGSQLDFPMPPPSSHSATGATGAGSFGGSSIGGGSMGSPTFPPPNLSPRPTAVTALASENSVAGTSDTQSVRSGTSLGSLVHSRHPDMTAPGLNSSIIETVSVHYEGGELKTASISGEIAFVNNSSDSTKMTITAHETIRINDFASLDRIGPNRIFVQNTSADQPDQFSLDVSHLTKMTTAFSYRVFSPSDADPSSLGQHAPLELLPAWKPQGDKLGLLIQYRLNPSSVYRAPLTLHNVVLVATYEGRAAGAQTKPTGTHLKDRHLVYWRLGEVTLTPNTQKIVCRILGAEGIEPAPGHVEARWEYTVPAGEEGAAVGSPISISRLVEAKGKEPASANSNDDEDVDDDDDPFADADARSDLQSWVDVPLTKKLVSGKYEGK
ncbi:F-BAR domain only protein [Geosmithia morbida]|uniref:F-BAR domain only protein n=1 Tax=Geosmithia morbida TaxID=1094350 RepID=A0A9P5D4T1_9HYPO|nr:F-BAR domain only protein [Geosmithia morbida]KAF4123080.1 F-BAR domain only protein [Geosmithia morbida]